MTEDVIAFDTDSMHAGFPSSPHRESAHGGLDRGELEKPAVRPPGKAREQAVHGRKGVDLHVEAEGASGSQRPEALRAKPPDEILRGQVLQDVSAEHGVDGSIFERWPQAVVQPPFDIWTRAVASCEFKHARRDVQGMHDSERVGQRAGNTARAAADLHHRIRRHRMSSSPEPPEIAPVPPPELVELVDRPWRGVRPATPAPSRYAEHRIDVAPDPPFFIARRLGHLHRLESPGDRMCRDVPPRLPRGPSAA